MSNNSKIPQKIHLDDLAKKIEKQQKQLKDFLILLDKKVEARIKQLLELNKNLEQKLREKNAQLKEIQDQLVQASKLAALGTLGAGVAHELNNPLTVVSAEADEILDALEGDYFDLHLAAISAKNIKSHAERMRVIIEHIRQFARDDKNSEWAKLSINEPIKDSLILLRNQLENMGIEIHLCLTEDLPKIWGHHNKLESVFQNLITNARDAFLFVNDERKKRLTISTDLKGKNQIVVKFMDNACGMSDEILDKIFNPFFTTKDVNNGTGLGLAITQNNIKEHGGKISVKSKEGEGTVFTLVFPLERRKKPKESKAYNKGA